MSTVFSSGWFNKFVKITERNIDSVGVLIVANIKGQTEPIDDYEGNSIISEFLSTTELDNLVKYFESARIYCQTVIDEQGFTHWLINERHLFPRRHIIVYNLAQNGTGPGRLTTVPGLCRIYNIPLLDSDAYAVAIVHHKFHTLSLLKNFDLPIAPSWYFTKNGWFVKSPPEGARLIAKPCFESASIGVNEDSVFTLDKSSESFLKNKVDIYKQPLTVQQFIEGYEIEVPVFESGHPFTLASIGVGLNKQRILGDKILTYENVFGDQYDFYDFAEENEIIASETRRIAEIAFEGLGMKGMGRIDFRINEKGQIFLMEVNSKPHITKHSSFDFALKKVRLSGQDLVKFLVGAAILRYRMKT